MRWLGTVGGPGRRVLHSADGCRGSRQDRPRPVSGDVDSSGAAAARGGEPAAQALLMLDGVNPVFTAPRAWKVRDALAKVPYRQLRQLPRRNERPGRPDPAGPLVPRVLDGRRCPNRDRLLPLSSGTAGDEAAPSDPGHARCAARRRPRLARSRSNCRGRPSRRCWR